MNDLREKVIYSIERCICHVPDACRDCAYDAGHLYPECFELMMKDALSLMKAQESQWRPFVKCALTEEEQKRHPDWCYILDGEVPEDEEEILVYRPWNNKAGYIIEMDTYCNNGDEVYLDGAGDIENGMYWMPLPEPPKEDEHGQV